MAASAFAFISSLTLDETLATTALRVVSVSTVPSSFANALNLDGTPGPIEFVQALC